MSVEWAGERTAAGQDAPADDVVVRAAAAQDPAGVHTAAQDLAGVHAAAQDMTAPNVVARAAAVLREAYRTGVPCPPLRERLLPVGDVATAYAVQRELRGQWLAEGRRQVGAKIGLTNPAVQRQLGVDEPDFGVLFADQAVPDGAEVPLAGLLQPRVEAEVAFVLGAELPHPQVTSVDIIRATDFLLPAIEIADCRVAGWDISIVDTVADNAAGGRFVLGNRPLRLADVDLRLCGMVLECGGVPVSVGAGAACLGNPLHALTWLAGTLARAGSPLRAGDVVLSGALGPMVPVTPGAGYEARISGLGSVRVRFEATDSDRAHSGDNAGGGRARGDSAGSDRAHSGDSAGGGRARGDSAGGDRAHRGSSDRDRSEGVSDRVRVDGGR